MNKINNAREKATCIVFYDFDFQSVDVKHWFDVCINLFESMRIPLVYLSASAKDINWKKVKTFKYGKRFIEKRGFKDLEDLSIESNSPHELPHSIEREASACIGINISQRSYMTFYVNEKVLLFDDVENIIAKLSNIVQPKYGFVHQREYFKGPIFYTWGVIMGIDNDNERDAKECRKISTWNHQYQLSRGQYRTGLLRDIYPLNLLSQTHLEKSIYGSTLRSWIQSSPDHGQLKPLTKDLWSWWVPEENIPLVADALKESGIIICT